MAKCCSRCHISVFHAEQINALGQLYHKQCFQCSNPSCHRLLDASSFKAHDGKIFCNFCYDERVHKSKFDVLGTNRLNTSEEIERAYQPAAYSIKKYDNPPKCAPDVSQNFEYRKENKKEKKNKISPVNAKIIFATNLQKPNDCNRCNKKVYEAEKMTAAGQVWHKLCFRCSMCGKSLEPGKYSEREHEIFCSKCYAKEFGPKGVGCGIGAGILQMHQ